MEFLRVDSIEEARAKLLDSSSALGPRVEALPFMQVLGRILAEDIQAPEAIPGFRRSTVDGFAVVAADTAAAGESLPVFLKKVGSVQMGQSADFSIKSGECAEVPTGAMLPEGADAVVMMEYAEPFGGDGVALSISAAYGENVVLPDEDAAAGAIVLRRGKRILPQDIGVLAAIGFTTVSVYKKLKITVLSTGDELVEPDAVCSPGLVRDVNTYALTALAVKNGYEPVGTAVIPDDEAALESALREAMGFSDLIAVSGGSSKGKKDMTRAVFDRMASPGVFTHGLAVKPGKPSILGWDSATNTLLAGLPGHPVSAMMVFELLFGWLSREMTGATEALAIPARLCRNLASSPGKTTCWPVKLSWTGKEYTAEPVFGKSGLISTLTQADGYFTVPRDAEGLSAGQLVRVYLF